MRDIPLNWQKFDSFAALLKTSDSWEKHPYQVPGVYMHVEMAPSSEQTFVGYVGRAKGKPTLVYRQLEHYRNYIGGIYATPREFLNADRDWYTGLRKNGVITENPKEASYFDVIFDENKFKNTISKLFTHVNTVVIYLAELDKEQSEIAERIMIHELKPLRNGQLNWRPNGEYTLVHKGAVTEEVYRKLQNNNRTFWECRCVDLERIKDMGDCLI